MPAKNSCIYFELKNLNFKHLHNEYNFKANNCELFLADGINERVNFKCGCSL